MPFRLTVGQFFDAFDETVPVLICRTCVEWFKSALSANKSILSVIRVSKRINDEMLVSKDEVAPNFRNFWNARLGTSFRKSQPVSDWSPSWLELQSNPLGQVSVIFARLYPDVSRDPSVFIFRSFSYASFFSQQQTSSKLIFSFCPPFANIELYPSMLK